MRPVGEWENNARGKWYIIVTYHILFYRPLKAPFSALKRRSSIVSEPILPLTLLPITPHCEYTLHC